MEEDEEIQRVKRLLAERQRTELDPDAASDEELLASWGMDGEQSAAEIRASIKKSTFGRPAKDKRASARAKLRRRVLWVSRALDDLEAHIQEVFDAPGRTNRKAELENLRGAIKEFRASTGIVTPPELDVDFTAIERMLGMAPLGGPPEK